MQDIGSSRCSGRRSLGTPAAAQFDRMPARELDLFEVGRDDGFAIVVPFGIRPVPQGGDNIKVVERAPLIKRALDWLDLEQRQACLEVD